MTDKIVEFPKNYGTKEHPCSVPPPADPSVGQTGVPITSAQFEPIDRDTFGDPETLFNSRDWLENALVVQRAKVTGKGIGMGQADIDIELEGMRYNVSIRPLSPVVTPRQRPVE